jgi:hypothetical protein
VSRWLTSVMTGLASQPERPADDPRRFWELVRVVRDQIRIGLVNEKAKADATELFHRAAMELRLTHERASTR